MINWEYSMNEHIKLESIDSIKEFVLGVCSEF